MLVIAPARPDTRLHSRPGIRPDDDGAALVVALVVMLVLGVAGLTAAAIVTNTTSSLIGGRDSAQARAAADAGLAQLVGQARRTGALCGMTVTNNDAPRYEASSTCTGDRVTFRATGHGETGRDNTIEAVFEYTVTETGAGGDMVFFGTTTFTREVLTHTLDENLLSIVIPSGDFTCMAKIPANIVVSGAFSATGNCTVEGSVVAGGRINMQVGSDTVRGSVSSSGTGSSTVRGTIGGDFTAAGGIDFGWDGKPVNGSVTTAGDVALGSARIQGSLTLPEGKRLTMNSGTVAGSINRPATITPPEAPTFEHWFDYRFAASDWAGYSVLTLSASGSGPGTCNSFNSWPATGWTDLANLTGPTVVDARACGSLSSNSGTHPVVALRHDLVLLAKSFDLTRLTLDGASGAAPKVWLVVEDTVDNDVPSCSGGAGNITINGTVMTEALTTMAYTPCTIAVQGQGFDTWTGAFYGGGFSYGGGLSFYGDPILLPGMPSEGPVTNDDAGRATLGVLVSQRDVP